jgi:anti-sigma factor RsiW
MNPDPVYQQLRELSWRRPLTAAEEAELRAWLVAHPEAQAEAEVEGALDQALARLPDAPVPSNFTARVWQTIERDAAAPEHASKPPSSRWWRVIVPRFAVASVVVGAGLLVYRHHEAVQQVELVKSFLAVAESPSLADPKVIEDFEVICQLSPPTAVDEELLKLME